ncbi:right-handed parallel beta-helix repeat-containing protein [uncultured Roseovarius sp.]|uniref:right-handed parallel beta-helix repeat-containing protein n=1 Tax=uncultured Roseovarius sp. TaxID=293344 RepID=UPI0025EA9A68|nr:right-handed parallel beta-helix repeat-containing protein [uncultured Roseovarius sp.]
MAAIYSVSTAEELMNALASASGSDTIELAGGDYGDLTLIDGKTGFDVTFDTEVTIRSADATQPASFSGLDLRGVSNLTFDGLVFDYVFSADDPSHISPFQVGYGSSYVTIKNSVFDGDVASGISEIDDGYGYGVGLNVRGASNISVENNEFFNWTRGAVYAQTENLLVTGNEVYAIRSDGFDFVEVNSVLIEGNYIHDFAASPNSADHRDMIQFWTSGTTSPTTDVIIRDNILDIGEGSYTQSIFMGNEEVVSGRAGPEMYYQNILIENNTIYNAHTHGITVGETNGLIIRNNSILQVEGEMHGLSGSVTIPKINVKSDSVSVIIEGNITSGINGFDQQTDWTILDNAFIQPSEYLEHFVTSTIDTENGANQYIILPDSAIEQLGAGSSHIQFPYTSETLAPQFQVHSDASSGQILVFDASLSVGALGLLSENDATFTWTFGDGSTATGQIVKHEFASAGYHDVTLTVTTQDGTSAETHFTTGIAGDDLVQFDAQSGLFEALAFGEETALDSGAMPLLTTADGFALRLGGEGTQASVAASELSRFFGTDEFEMSMTLKAGSAAGWGEIARIHTSFTASVDQDGNFSLDLFFDDGSRMNMKSQGISLLDGALHDVTVRFDGEAGFAEILIDGQVVASENVSGSLGGGPRSLDFGNPWGSQNFEGELSAFALSAESLDFPIYDGAADLPSDTPTEGTTTDTPPADTTTDAPTEDTTTDTPTEDTTTDTTVPTDPEPLPEEDSGALEPLLHGGYELDFASAVTSGSITLYDDAHIIETLSGAALSFDGKKDSASLGRLTEFEESQKIAFSIDFTSTSTRGGAEKLVWNDQKIGLTLEGDGVRVHVGNTDYQFSTGFLVDGLGLNDGNTHTATVMVDAETDRLQVVVDDVLVLDEQGTDFDLAGAGGHDQGWYLGTPRNQWFEGEVSEFQVSDDFTFIDPVTEDGAILV